MMKIGNCKITYNILSYALSIMCRCSSQYSVSSSLGGGIMRLVNFRGGEEHVCEVHQARA